MSFIRREILALERRGVEVMRIALRGWDSEFVDRKTSSSVSARVTSFAGRASAAVGPWRAAAHATGAPAAGTGAAWRMGRRAERPLPVHLAYLAEACRIEPGCAQQDPACACTFRHQFGRGGDARARTWAGRPGASPCTAQQNLTRREFIGLPEKVRRCAFVVAITSYGRSQLYRFVEHEHWPKVKVVHCGSGASASAIAR